MTDRDRRERGTPREGERPPEVVLHEERVAIERRPQPAGVIRVAKSIDAEHGVVYVPRDREDAEMERHPAQEGDSGEVETLEDGSISIPVLEEEIVVTKRLVVRERVIVRRQRHTEEVPVEVELRRERVAIEGSAADVDDPKDAAHHSAH